MGEFARRDPTVRAVTFDENVSDEKGGGEGGGMGAKKEKKKK